MEIAHDRFVCLLEHEEILFISQKQVSLHTKQNWLSVTIPPVKDLLAPQIQKRNLTSNVWSQQLSSVSRGLRLAPTEYSILILNNQVVKWLQNAKAMSMLSQLSHSLKPQKFKSNGRSHKFLEEEYSYTKQLQ